MNTDTNIELTPLMRQRRFLMLMSLAVIAYYWLGLTVQPQFSHSGFLFSIATPERVVVGLWGIWGWALLRFAQRFYQELQAIKIRIYKEKHKEETRIIRPTAEKMGRESFPAAVYIHLPADRVIEILQPSDGKIIYRCLLHVVNPAKAKDKEYVECEVSIFKHARVQICAWFWACLKHPSWLEYVGPLIVAAGAAAAAGCFLDPPIPP